MKAKKISVSGVVDQSIIVKGKYTKASYRHFAQTVLPEVKKMVKIEGKHLVMKLEL